MRRAVAAFFKKAYDDNLTGLAAMVAYNLILSVLPLALVALFVAGRILSSENVEASVLEDLERLFPQAAQSTLIDGLRRIQESSTTRRRPLRRPPTARARLSSRRRATGRWSRRPSCAT
jgi:uncharacterized BrkB/YihY/UPF0761 family membrane protein